MHTHPGGIFYQLFKWNGTAGGIRCRRAFCGWTCGMDEHRKVSLTHLFQYTPHINEALKNNLYINTLFLQAHHLQMFQRALCCSRKDCQKEDTWGNAEFMCQEDRRGGLVAIDVGEGFLLSLSSGEDKLLFCQVHLFRQKALGSHRNKWMKCKGLK